MTKGIFVHRTDSIYDDSPAEQYQFPRQYLTRGIASPTIKHELRRRNAIEPIIGHTKSDGLLERNHLAGATGDAIKAILVAEGHNLRLLIAWLNALLRALLTAWLPVARRNMAPA